MTKNDQAKDVDLMNTKDISETQLEALQRSLAKRDEQANKDSK